MFKCHKVFLCAISDYFLAMFTSGMRECGDSRVAIRDLSLSGGTFKTALDFYYTCDRYKGIYLFVEKQNTMHFDKVRLFSDSIIMTGHNI